MKIVLLGTGNIAHYFCTRLAESKTYKVIQAYARDQQKGLQFQEHFNIPVVNHLEEIDEKSAIYFLAVKDNAIAELASKIKSKNALIIHCAGSQNLEIIENDSQKKAIIWPIYSISKQENYAQNIPLIIEGNNKDAENEALKLALEISQNTSIVNYAQRQYLHLNAVLVNNFSNHLFAIADAISKERKIDFDILKPIIHQTIQNLNSKNPAETQTGPAIRHDEQTINKHLTLLDHHPEWQELYKSISLSIQKMYPQEK
ncbi:MAG TPA: DUF2520 domain-containing protein [Edaphocola sp.]|nr:DUF2520 domain-containing protein [Edaphocola sp.]